MHPLAFAFTWHPPDPLQEIQRPPMGLRPRLKRGSSPLIVSSVCRWYCTLGLGQLIQQWSPGKEFSFKSWKPLKLCWRRRTHSVSPGLQTKCNWPLFLPPPNHSTEVCSSHSGLKLSPEESSLKSSANTRSFMVWSLPLYLGSLPLPWYHVLYLHPIYCLNMSCSWVSLCLCNYYSCYLGCLSLTGELL